MAVRFMAANFMRVSAIVGPSVIIECTNCRARYQYDEDRFERKPSKKIKCAKCSTIFDIHNPAFAAAPKSEPQSADQTFQKRNEVRKPEAPPEERSTVSEDKDTGKVSGPQMPQGKRL